MVMVIRRFILVALAAVALAACGGPDLKNVNLEPVLVQDGDLLPGLTAGQVTDGRLALARQRQDSSPGSLGQLSQTAQ
jgi:hypothetical protein